MKLVLLPGMDGTGDLFEPFINALPPTLEAVVVRYPRDEPLGYSDLEALARKHLPADEPYLLLGESFSGPIAIAIAGSRPEQLKGLILACTFASCPRPRLAVLAPLVSWMSIPKLPRQLMKQILLSGQSYPELEPLLNDTVKTVTAEVFRRRLEEAISIDATNSLRDTTVPVVYLRAGQDRLIPRSAGDEILRVLPAAELIEIESPHSLLQVAPTLAINAIEAWQRTLGQP